MAKADDSNRDMRITGGGRSGGGFRRFLITVLVIAFIAWATLFISARTDGGHRFVVNQLKERLGVDIRVEQVRFAFPFTLVLDGVKSEHFEHRNEGLQVRQARLSLGVSPWWRLSLKEPELNLTYRRSEGWAPNAFAHLGELPGELPSKDLHEIAELTGGIHKTGKLHIIDGSLTWLNASGRELGAARNIEFRMAPAAIPRHRMTYYYLRMKYCFSVEQVANPRETRFKNVVCEWLSSSDVSYVEIRRSEIFQNGRGQAFWGAPE